jgi:hypothetical protein
MSLSSIFERVVCINLDRRPDRWEEFTAGLPADWPFREVQRYTGIDGKLAKHPDWWKQGAGAFGCFRTHLRIIEETINSGTESVLIFEDDAIFCDDFAAKCAEFFTELPDDWEWIYLGGQLLDVESRPPLRITDNVFVPYNVNRTHAYGCRGKEFMQVLYRWLNVGSDQWRQGHHIDHHYGRMHGRAQRKIYAPGKWLVGQRESHSNIKGQVMPERYWPALDEVQEKAVDVPFVLVLGAHRSGSSCVATILRKLGVHLGNVMIGFEKPPSEARDLAAMCEEILPLPATELKRTLAHFKGRFAKWSRGRSREAYNIGTIAGGKYPQLCALAQTVEEVVGKERLLIVNCERSLEESIESMQRRVDVVRNGFSAADIERHQRFLHEAKCAFLATRRHHTVDYDRLLADPAIEIDRLAGHLGLDPTGKQRSEAYLHVDAGRRHYGAAELVAT